VVDDAAAGLLWMQSDAVTFRHEIARLAVAKAIPPERARALHQKLLAVRLERGSDVTELLHHATFAQDAAVVLKYAPVAAREAARLGAHREAAAHLGAALRYAGSLPTEQRASLFEQHAQECGFSNETREAIDSAGRAIALYRQVGDIEAQARLLCLLSQKHRTMGARAQADECVAAAIEMLEARPPGAALAMAYDARASLAVLRGWDTEALEFGRRALALAREFGDVGAESYALANIGAALLGGADVSGYEPLERSLALALEHKLDEHAARAHRYLLFYAALIHDLERAEELYAAGLAYCEERGMFYHSAYIRAYYTTVELDRGNLAEAARIVASQLRSPDLTGVQQRITLLVTLALVRIRREDPGAAELLDEALDLALPTSELNRIGRVTAARAEHGWYRGDLQTVVRETETGLEHVRGHTAPWIKGELLWWRSRAQPLDEISSDVAEPWRLMLRGEWQGAASLWERMGMPYEQGLALGAGPPQMLRQALSILDRLGAAPLATIVRKRMRECGVRVIPRGPNEKTRANPAGLTAREVEVLTLLTQGCSNSQLAHRLHRSQKTMEHHVSAILQKLGVASRAEAVAAAVTLGLVRSP
jgi:DNA-binding CsgD family transcriptional regulator